MISDENTYTVPAEELCRRIMDAAPLPASPVIMMRRNGGIVRITGIHVADDGIVEVEIQ